MAYAPLVNQRIHPNRSAHQSSVHVEEEMAQQDTGACDSLQMYKELMTDTVEYRSDLPKSPMQNCSLRWTVGVHICASTNEDLLCGRDHSPAADNIL